MKEHPVSPYLVCKDAQKAIEFYKKAFNAEEVMVVPFPDGSIMHATLIINGSSVMLTEENEEYNSVSPKTLGNTPVSVHLIVDDVDAVFSRAVEAGASVDMEPEDCYWGDRFSAIKDPFGHSWTIATVIKEMTVEEIQEEARKYHQSEQK